MCLNWITSYFGLGTITCKCVNVFENQNFKSECRDAKDLVLSALIFSFPEKRNQPTINNDGIKMTYSLFGLML